MEFSEQKMKHLEFLQNNITRMSQCSFQMKGWMVTIVAAFLALYASSVSSDLIYGNWFYLLVAIVPTIIFWALDTYYLVQERKFRGIYADIISGEKEIKEFEMPLDKYNGCDYCVFKVMFSRSELVLYLPVIISLAVTVLVLRSY